MKKAVFLDRDGVINRDIADYTYRISDFTMLPGVVEALKNFHDKGYLLIIITNQGGIAKKLYGHEEVAVLHRYLLDLFKKKGIEITEIYYCPHHPDFGKCLCRKPGSLMLEKALARFNIDPTRSYFIGDMDRDIEAGRGAGVNTIKVDTNGSMLSIIDRIP